MTYLPLLALLLPGHAAPAPTFERDVRPILKAHCLECHGEAARPKGGLDLRLRRLIVRGGDAGPAVVPGKPEESPLFTRARDHEMPPGKVKLSREELDRLGAWVAAGAPVARAEPEKLTPGLHISDDDRAWWAFQPVRRPPVPAVRQGHLVRNPIDAFLLARLEARGLSFSPMADRETLLRRLAFGLAGLPPGEDAGEPYERVVERLLASPAHGERWGRHWLDVAGYADSHGYTGDPPRPYAWKYRDWVLRALNADKPFNDFVTEQLAGDELIAPPYETLSPDDQDRLIATGYLRTAPDGMESPGANRKEATNQLVADTVQVVATSLLGLTLHCAQCHNHRYDPIPQADYYRLRAVFEPAYDVANWRGASGRLVSLLTAAERARGAEVEREAATIDRERLKKQEGYIERTFQRQLAKVPEAERGEVEKAYRAPTNQRSNRQAELLRRHPSVNVSSGSLYLYDKKAADDLQAYSDRAKALRATKPAEDFLDALTEVPGRAPVTHLLHRGDPDQRASRSGPAG
ncbi:MAG: DUF1549 domain-containing protein [Gemmataceae bacterium]